MATPLFPFDCSYTTKEFKAGFVPLEHEEQVAVVEYLQKVWPMVRFFAVPNGEYRPKRTAMKLQEAGVKAGIPDICIPCPRGDFHGLYLEMKRRKGSTVSDVQKEWISYLRAQGYEVHICLGADHAIKMIEAYLGLGRFDSKKEAPYDVAFAGWAKSLGEG